MNVMGGIFLEGGCILEPCAGRVNPRGSRVPALAGRVRVPAQLGCGLRGGCGLTPCGAGRVRVDQALTVRVAGRVRVDFLRGGLDAG